MESVKRSVYLDADLIEPLKASAAGAGRSVTKQMNVLLRNGLGLEQMHRASELTGSKKSYQPDPRVKAPRRRSA